MILPIPVTKMEKIWP